ncbi:MAG: hypothetical protein JW934_06695 [Anaerolineae bacterium]|nr:hypothetical protein [Anaerolineae bacterium]
MPKETITHQKVVDLVMTLSKDRLTSVYDFVRFIQSYSLESPAEDSLEADIFGETDKEIQADEAQREQQFAASRDELGEIAREAATKYRAGKTKPMLTYHDLEIALKRVPVERLPEVYEFVLARAEWPFDASPAEMQADDYEWDRRFATEASQASFKQVAAKVRAEIASEKTEPLESLLTEDEATDDIKDDAPVQTAVSETPR